MICKNLPVGVSQKVPVKPELQIHRRPPVGTTTHTALFLQRLLVAGQVVPVP